ncbi:NAD(P)/FAD-dependent oxidoreductase [Bacillus sp. AFS088145]|uniref:flavin monoamine oxidase family protein n=1 Tax=Bacillus sp. AFS088145 TaxID=2033514 RepID=UPI0015CF7492|nr:NAD(P)/FAD-dependent oxidoreductase [Bacillus sp. AFS088145]
MVKIVNDSKEIYDVIIIGAGFAGITASRELSNRGFKTLILEGRDRIGGRTWTEKRLGRDLELGGTWVHWSQPHVWTEIMRYGLELTPSPSQEVAYWFENGKLKKGTKLEFFQLIGDALTSFLEESRLHIPLPYLPLTSSTMEEIDKQSVDDRLDELNLDKVVYDNLKNFLEACFNGPTDVAAYSTLLHWYSLSMHDLKTLFETIAKFKLVEGTKSLIDSIASDSSADIQFNKTVTLVEQIGDVYKVNTVDSVEYKAKTVITTLPINILNKIEFKPALSKLKQLAAIEGQTSKGIKFFAKLRGKYEPFSAYAPSGSPINICNYEYDLDGDSIIVGFGSDASRINPNDLPAIQNEVRRWIPEAEVLECTGHDWVADEFSGQTWNMQKRNQKTRYMAELQRPEQGVFLSGCDYANGWPGMMDGAIESGLVVSRKVQEYLNLRSAKMINLIN